MSSDQQLNIHISIVNDLCHSSDTQETNTLDEIIAANIVLENEAVKICSEYTEDYHGETSSFEINENHKPSLAIDECINFHSDQNSISLGEKNGNNFEDILDSTKLFQFEENDDAFCYNVGTEELDISNCDFGGQNDKFACNFDGQLITQLAIKEQFDIVDPQIRPDTPTNITLPTDKSNNEFPEVSNQKQPQNSFEGIELNGKNNGTNFNETTKEPEVCNEDSPNNVSGTTNQIAESPTVTSPIEDEDGEEVEKSDEALSDENEIISNETDIEDSGEFPDVVDFDGTNEVENDEYILDTVVRKSRKGRRRIVSLNDDDSDPEIEVERKRLLQSPIDEELSDGNVEENIDLELLKQHEKPGPKSKKMSTQKLKELQARALLRSAVVIPSTSGKKKKSRVIDSDDEDNAPLPYCVDVDDIGLPDMNEDNDEGDVLVASSIFLNEIDKTDEYPIEVSKKEENIGENSICATSPSQDISLTVQCNIENMPIVTGNCKSPSQNYESNQNVQTHSIEMVPESVECELSEPIPKVETTSTGDSGISADSINQQSVKENDFPTFLSSSSSNEDDDEFIPNDVYFGSPDVVNTTTRKSTRGSGRRRGRPARTSSQGIATPPSVTKWIGRGRGSGRRGRPRHNQFLDNRQIPTTSRSLSTSSSNESEDEYQKSKARRKAHTVGIVKAPSELYHNVSLPNQQPVQKQQKIQRKQHRKRDRFYDKSQDIPNSIYFGDVDVPLHVLYAYGDSDSDNDVKVNWNFKTDDKKFDYSKGNAIRFSSPRGRGRSIPIPVSNGQMHSEVGEYSNGKPRGRPKMINSLSPSNDESIQMMKKFLKAAGLKKVKLNRLWEGCKSNSERAEKMLELLREKGLEGEPTIAKCKQLKIDYLTKKEIEDLDPNLIIQTEGRTRRSVTRAATKRQYTYDEEEIQETRTKLKKVIDSDSDYD